MLRLRRLLIHSYIDPTLKSVLGATRLCLRIAGAKDLEKLLKVASERWLGYEKTAFCKGNTSYEASQVVSKDSGNDPVGDRTEVIPRGREFVGPGHPVIDFSWVSVYLIFMYLHQTPPC